jgi:hypothetical protein
MHRMYDGCDGINRIANDKFFETIEISKQHTTEMRRRGS